ncbi:tellurite resistance TerB family protein [Fodinicurvata halophila]
MSKPDIHGYVDDGGMASFVRSPNREEKSSNKRPGEWIGPDQVIEFKGQRIEGGNFYLGGRLPSLSYSGQEASLIDDHLSIRAASPDYSDETLGYWPKYNQLSPKCRGAYLAWLSSSRDRTDVPIGYVFIYFYGLERRGVHDSRQKDAVTDAEFRELAAEVRRLLSIYSYNRSFSAYGRRLLEWMALLRPDVVELTDEEILDHSLRQAFSLRVGRYAVSGQPIDPTTAFLWLRFSEEFTFRAPARRCYDEFKELFRLKYEEKYGEGFKVKPNKTLFRPTYHPASGTLRGQELEELELPDPTGLKSHQKKVARIGDECCDELDAYSRYLGRNDEDEPGLEGLLLLPNELLEARQDGTLENIQQWASDIIDQREGQVSTRDFWAQVNDEKVTKLNKKEITLLQAVGDKAGFGFAPDPRWHDAKPKAEDTIVLFDTSPGPDYEPSSAFYETGMSVRLGAMVAQGDGHVHTDEAQILKSLIEEHPELRDVERRSLLAYLQYRLINKPSTAGLKARLEELSEEAKHAVSRFLVSVALADGVVTPDEIRQLEKLYTQLGLDKSLVSSDVHGVTATRAPADYKEADQSSASKPAHTDKAATGREAFRLDESVLAFHASETRDVQSMLGRIFAEEGAEENKADEEEVLSQPADPQSTNGAINGLDAAHSALYLQMTERETWSRTQIETLCNEMELMMDGALEAINDWAFDTVDDAVIEDAGDTIYMRPDVVDEIAERVE